MVGRWNSLAEVAKLGQRRWDEVPVLSGSQVQILPSAPRTFRIPEDVVCLNFLYSVYLVLFAAHEWLCDLFVRTLFDGWGMESSKARPGPRT